MLYLVATPIGNLEDITLRALSTLKKVDYILAEDTRRTQILLNRYDIHKKLVSFHKGSEKEKENQVLEDLALGKEIALVSDAGMPTISDPGSFLVAKARELGHEVTCIPGATSVWTAFSLSGLVSERVQFLGFLPEKSSLIKQKIEEAENYPGVTIFFETPHDLLKHLALYKPETRITLARELTKMHEEVLQGSAETLLADLKKREQIKGEIVLLVEGTKPLLTVTEAFEEELMTLLQTKLSRSDAAKILGTLTKKGKKWFY